MLGFYEKFCRIKRKIHTYIAEYGHECKKAKGINKNVVNDELKYEDYKNVLLSGSHKRHEMDRMQSQVHNIRTYRINKVSLSCYNDKNYILEGEYHKLSHFHKSTR